METIRNFYTVNQIRLGVVASEELKELPHARELDFRPSPVAPTNKDESSEAKLGKKKARLFILGLLLIVGLTAGGWYGWRWYTVDRFLIETDDAYTQADNITISPQVAGYISDLLVTDNQHVEKGDVIARIDDRIYRTAVNKARAELDTQIANEHNVVAQIERQRSVIEQVTADVASVRAQLKFAEEERTRYVTLMQRGSGTLQKAQQTDSALQAQQANLAKSKANLNASQQELAVLQAQKEQAHAAVEQAQAALDQAQINLGYTTITAPHDGVVGDRSVRIGQLVQPGTRLLTLVPMRDVYVVANYKETQLEHMRSGQPVEMSVDGYPDLTLRGHVDSFAPGSGAQFALLPPENATGNFTKIVQRVPVKIVIDRDNEFDDRLRPGLSVISSVDVRENKSNKLARSAR